MNLAGYLGQYETFRFMERIGIPRMFDHAVTLSDRIRKGLPESRYQCITPPGVRSPIVTFTLSDVDDTRKRLKKANIQVTVISNRMRVSPSVYNDARDGRPTTGRSGFSAARGAGTLALPSPHSCGLLCHLGDEKTIVDMSVDSAG